MLSEVGSKILKNKYTQEGENWSQVCARVASYIASIEDDKQVEYTAKFFQMLYERVFLPGGRILANAGTSNKNLMNCFVLPVEDSRKGIYSSLNDAAEIFNRGGGVGYNFSKIRQEGSPIKGVDGKASGPVAFMELFNQTGDLIQQSSRRGAQMGILSIDHPDIEKFIDRKVELNNKNKNILSAVARELGVSLGDKEIYELGFNSRDSDKFEFLNAIEKILADNQLTYFNISVAITDKFMEAVNKDLEWNLISPQNGEVTKTLKAKELFNKIAKSAWESGDPGVYFIDRANEDNMVPYLGSLDAENPCGEIPLLPYESCCLGSINLLSFYDISTREFNYEFLEYVIRLAVRFLDNVQTLSESGVDKINEISKATRRLGLGVMGWADLLAEMEIPYDSDKAIEFAKKLSAFISFFAWSESLVLADERGSFPQLDLELADQHVLRKIINNKEFVSFDKSLEENIPVRNVSVTAIAPTGSIALLADVNSAIEPFYSLSYTRYITEGEGNKIKDTIKEINSILLRKLTELKILDSENSLVRSRITKTGSIQGIEEIPPSLREVFKTAHEISWESHIRMQAAWQSSITNAVSKTINLPHKATVKDIERAIMLMWESKLKGSTIYRDGSKSFQVLNSGD